MDKFTLKPQEKHEGYKMVMISVSTHDLISQMKDMSGVSMTKIVEEAVKFAFERLEVNE